MLRHKDQAGADETIAAFHSGFDFFFQVCGGITNPQDSQVFCTHKYSVPPTILLKIIVYDVDFF